MRRHPRYVDRTVEAVVFDWDGTAVPDRRARADAVRGRVERLVASGAVVAVVSGTHVGNVDGQLRARPTGVGRLLLALNRGSELYEVGPDGPRLLRRRTASAAEDAALDRAAAGAVAELARRGLGTRVVSARLNRRKIDLIPEPEWSDPPKARIAELLDAVLVRLRRAGIESLAEVASITQRAAVEAGLERPRVTSDVKHVEVGLTDKADSMRAILDELADRGVGPGLVLVVGDEFGSLAGLPGSDALLLLPDVPRLAAVSVGIEPEGVPPRVCHVGGGPLAFRALLDEQLRRRRLLRVPEIDPDPAWVVVEDDGDGTRRRVADALFTLSDGELSTRGAAEDAPGDGQRLVLAAGVYHGQGAGQRLLPGPWWPAIRPSSGTVTERRTLDLRSGLLLREGRCLDGDAHAPAVRTLRFVSAANPHLLGVRAEGPAGRLGLEPPSTPGRDAAARGSRGPMTWVRTSSDVGGGIAVLSRDRGSHDEDLRTVERLATYVVDARGQPRPWQREPLLREGADRGFGVLLAEHRRAWARRWREVTVEIPDDPDLELAARFALFHLWGAAAARDRESAVGARGLTGLGYAGHVFWDADVYVLPVLAMMSPPAARAVLGYRLHRLHQARAAAQARGCGGARFPWESARDGDDVTPRASTGSGPPVPIRTGDLEEHITADVAWAADRYATWSGDAAWLTEHGHPLVLETARYWACRCRTAPDGSAHIDGVIGPDEYHEDVDDNAFTNVMARWNLRRGADLLEQLRGGPVDEARDWRALADRLVDGLDPASGVYEQFAGFHDLEPLSVSALGRVPIAADLVLPPERLRRSQVIKQPDVLMLHHLVPDEVVPGSLAANLDAYLPRTAHGSSLSPAIAAALLARAGRTGDAVDLLRIALRIDLDDLTGTTSAGLHLAAMGGAWQALVHGFAGVRVREGAVVVDPRLPADWHRLGLRLHCLGRRITLDVCREHVTLTTDGPLRVHDGGSVTTIRREAVLEPAASGWRVGKVRT